MDGSLDPDPFVIGELLHKSMTEVDAMPNNEYHQWRAYLVWKAAQIELARKSLDG